MLANRDGHILITQRRPDAHLGGLWEFPGGKLDPYESPLTALIREFEEELGIQVTAARPLINVKHTFTERTVALHVFRILSHQGTPFGKESQPLQWVPPDELPKFDFPLSNRPIVGAIRLPSAYPIIDLTETDSESTLKQRIELLAAKGHTLAQLRGKPLKGYRYRELAQVAVPWARARQLGLILNTDQPAWVTEIGASGIHLSSTALTRFTQRPLSRDFWVGASCHNLEEIERAVQCDADFAVLGPVNATATHPTVGPLGWETFANWVSRYNLPVFALGGLGPDHIEVAQRHGAQGVAGIRAFL